MADRHFCSCDDCSPSAFADRCKYEDALQQVVPVLDAIRDVMPERYEFSHPNLLRLYDIEQDMRNVLEALGDG